MIKFTTVVRRRPDMTHSEYAEYFRDVHGGLASANKVVVRKYVQNHVFDSAYGAAGDGGYQVTVPRDSVAELYFDDFEAIMRNMADPYSRDVVAADGVNFNDLSSAIGMLVEEHRPTVPNPGEGAVKVLMFLKAAEGLRPQEFQERWLQAHENVAADASGPAGRLRACTWNPAVALDGLPPAFGSDQPSYEGFAALWFEEADAVSAFRAYQKALTEHAEKLGPFHQPSLSFFLLSREIVVFDDLDTGATGK
ncbi:EthD domain-containing protein [Streptomyces sp. YKOK-I1]